MSQWILVNQEGLLTSLDRAKIISRELYNIIRPVFLQRPDEADKQLFNIITHPDDDRLAALEVDTNFVIYPHESCTLERLIAVFPELTIEERFALSSVIHQLGSFPFGLILPDTVTVRDYTYMSTNGWLRPYLSKSQLEPDEEATTIFSDSCSVLWAVRYGDYWV